MRGWPGLAVAVGAVALLAVLVLRGPAETTRGAGGRSGAAPQTERRGDPVPPESSTSDPGATETGEEQDDERTRPARGTERWHYERFLRMAADDPRRFDRLAEQKVGSGTPLQERVAFLRAAWKARNEAALRWFADAFAAAAGSTDEAEDRLRGFVVRHLAAQGRDAAEVRVFLTKKVFLDKTAGARDRSEAGRAVMRAADPREIAALLEPLCSILDETVAEGALVGLGRNAHADAASALVWLASHHPSKRVRERAAQVHRQRLAGGVKTEEED